MSIIIYVDYYYILRGRSIFYFSFPLKKRYLIFTIQIAYVYFQILIYLLQFSMQKLYSRQLFEEQLEEAAHILVKGFVYNNPVWQMLNPNHDFKDLYDPMLQRCRVSHNSVLAKGLFLNGKLIGAFISFYMKDYLNMQLKSTSQLYRKLGQIGKNLQTSLYQIEHDSKTLYLGYISILSEYTNNYYAFYFLNAGIRMVGKSRVNYSYARVSNPRAAKMVQGMGGKKINEIKLKDQNNNKQFSLILYKLDMRNIPSMQQILAKARSSL